MIANALMHVITKITTKDKMTNSKDKNRAEY